MTYPFRLRETPFQYDSELENIGISFDFDETLQGEVHPDKFDRYVYWVQQSLKKLVSPKLVEEGQMGGNTLRALRKFQFAKRLPLSTDGVVCPDTEQALIAEAGIPTPGIEQVTGDETSPGRTLYADISLQAPLGNAKSMTGIFLPENYCLVSPVHIIVFLHGFKVRAHDPKHSIDTYWSLPEFRLREEVNNSQKNVILVAPTLGPKNQPGSLICSGGFDKFMDQVLLALQQFGPYAGQNISLGNIILACHSGSWKVMEALAKGKDKYISKIREYWAFDPEYMTSMWKDWARTHGSTNLYIHYGLGRAGQSLCESLSGKRVPRSSRVSCLPNIFGEMATVRHDEIPRIYLSDRIKRAAFLVDKSTCRGMGPHSRISPMRNRSRPRELQFEISKAERNSRDYVRWVQRSLNQVLDLQLAVDGISGVQTRSAVRSFQQQYRLTVDGIVGPQTEQALIAAGAGNPSGGSPSYGTPSTQPATSLRVPLAQRVLSHPTITLWQYSPVASTRSDGADALSNIQATASGQAAKRSSYENTPGGSVALDTRMLEGLLKLADIYNLRITSIAGGSHSSNSRHYAGTAFDVDQINGVRVTASNPHYPALMRKCRALGATQVLGPGDSGHSTHVHCAW